MSDDSEFVKQENELMDVEEEQSAAKKKSAIGNSQDALQHFEKLLEKTENFARCLSAGDVEAAQQGFFNFLQLLKFNNFSHLKRF